VSVSVSKADPLENAPEPELSGDELPSGTLLAQGNYTIQRHLKSGGFGMTYVALDTLGRRVVIKECFPSGMCTRPNQTVQARSRSYATSVTSLTDRFLAEAHSMARLNHPNIVKVHQVFKENETAYMALDYVDGPDLLEVMRDPAHALSPDEIRSTLLKLLDAIATVHDNDILHRDISPDNILINANRNPVLIDFGAARDDKPTTERATSTLHVVKDGYSPQELYIGGGNQGPWSDLYSLAASFYHVISGEAPPNSQSRLAALATDEQDPCVPLAGRFKAYDAQLLASIDKAMAVLPKNRPQSARGWITAISDFETGKILRLPIASAAPPMDLALRATEADPQSTSYEPPSRKIVFGLVGAVALVAIAAVFSIPRTNNTTVARRTPEAVAPSPKGSDPAISTSAQPASAAPTFAETEATSAVAPLEATAAPTAVEAPALLDDQPIIASWAVELPFVATDADPLTIETAAPFGPSWLEPGVQIVAVNGQSITSIDEIVTLLQRSANPGDATKLTVTLSVMSSPGGEVSDQSIDLPVFHQLLLQTGADFRTLEVNGAWQTQVAALPPGYEGELRVGDIVVGDAKWGTKLDGIGSLEKLVRTAIAAEAETTTLAVERDGEMWVASLPLPK
jgi:serine/threonine protein kinase